MQFMFKRVVLVMFAMLGLGIVQMPYKFYANVPIVGEIQTEQFVICESCPVKSKLVPVLKNPIHGLRFTDDILLKTNKSLQPKEEVK